MSKLCLDCQHPLWAGNPKCPKCIKRYLKNRPRMVRLKKEEDKPLTFWQHLKKVLGGKY